MGNTSISRVTSPGGVHSPIFSHAAAFVIAPEQKHTSTLLAKTKAAVSSPTPAVWWFRR
jgi:hypothetical protein